MEPDGAEFFRRPGIATALYDVLFEAPSIAGDAAYYDAACGPLGPRILEAACGTGRDPQGELGPGNQCGACPADRLAA